VDNPGTKLAALNRPFLEAALDCIIMMDATGRVCEFNPAAERVFGFTRAEVIGKELAELIIPPRSRDRHRQGLAHYLKTGEGPLLGKMIEIQALRRDGTEILVQLAITVILIDGAPIFTAHLRDITELKRAEERFHIAVEAAPSGMIMIDEEGRIVLANAHAERLFGYSREELIGQPLDMLVPEHLRARHLAFRTGYVHEPSARPMGAGRYLLALRKDGSEVPVEIGLSPIRTAHGVMVLSAIVDITERVRSDRRRATQYAVTNLLAASWTLAEVATELLEAMATSGDWAFAAIWTYDEAAGGLRCRNVWHEASERVKKFSDLSLVVTLPEGQGLPGRVWNSKKPTWVYDVTRDLNFPRAPYAAAADLHGGFAFPLFFHGEIDGIMELFSHNVVEPDEDLLKMVGALGSQIGLFIERGRIVQELEREKEHAGSADTVKDRFLAQLTDKLHAPLTPVLNWTGAIAEQSDLRPDLQQGLKMVRSNVELEMRLIQDMLDLTRIARGKLTLQLRKADAHELLQSALEIVRSDIEQRHLTSVVELTASRHELIADAPRLQQVFWSVLHNACKFTAENGTISVRSYNPSPRRITIEISDNGIGIERQLLQRVFYVFEQADSQSEGLGLGLALSKAIVEMHAGTIRAGSDGLGKGATFAIDLPIRESNH
jgi:PAS domain S-box-containing protein